MDWTAVPVYMIDFEGCTRSGIVEYGVVTLLGGRIEACQGRLCAATGPVYTDETRVHGIRGDDLTGLQPFSSDWDLFAGLRETGVSIVWIEHVVHALLAVVDRLIVINFGEKIADGDPKTVMESREVKEIYLGIEADA